MDLVTHKLISSKEQPTPDYKHSEPVNQYSILPFTKITCHSWDQLVGTQFS